MEDTVPMMTVDATTVILPKNKTNVPTELMAATRNIFLVQDPLLYLTPNKYHF